MAPTLYLFPASPPARAVLMTAKYLNLELELITINPMAGEHKTAEYSEMNPQRTVLTFKDDDGFVLWDSHAIMAYLVEKYGEEDDALYPKDYKKRAAINQRLHFDSGLFLPRLRKVLRAVFFQKVQPDPAALEPLQEAYGYLEKFLENHDYVAGDSLSIADLSLIACVTSEQTMGLIEYKKYPKIQVWMKLMEAVPCFSANTEALESMRKACEDCQKK